MTTPPRPMTLRRVRLLGQYARRRDSYYFLFMLFSILVLEKNLWGTRDDLYSYAFLVGSIHRSKVSDSSANESASSDDSLLEDPFSLQYVLHVRYFSVFISCEKVYKSISRASVHATVKQKRGT